MIVSKWLLLVCSSWQCCPSFRPIQIGGSTDNLGRVLGHLASIEVRTGQFYVFFHLAEASIFCLNLLSFCSSVYRNVLVFLVFISSVWIRGQNLGLYVSLGWARIGGLFSCSSIMMDYLDVLSPDPSEFFDECFVEGEQCQPRRFVKTNFGPVGLNPTRWRYAFISSRWDSQY